MTPYRFTSLYRFDGETLKNLFFYDRENPAVESSPDVPMMASYCVFVRNSGREFKTQDSLHDERLRDHPKRKEARSYCGVPLLDCDGKMFGTIYHFDLKPIPTADDDVELLEAMARLLKEAGVCE